jgi:hypothetical protein
VTGTFAAVTTHRHPLIKELLRRVEDNPADKSATDIAVMMYNTATHRSGYSLKDTVNFAQQIEAMMRQTLGVDADEMVDEEKEVTDEEPPEENDDQDRDKLFEDVTEVPAPNDGSTSPKRTPNPYHKSSPDDYDLHNVGSKSKTRSRRGTRRSR